MAQTATEPDTEKTPATGGAVARRASLEADLGRTSIADVVVTKIAGIAAREINGVHDLGGTAARTIGAVTSRLPVGDERARGVNVEVGEREAAVDLTIRIEYGESIPKVATAVRENVVKRIEGITGLKVTEVNIAVDDLWFPGDSQDEGARVQ
ncbi:hypothetical protein DSM112329_00316 [Paraconexibacter sp. AEG42_29]|uniref:Asp23/Gls24 family envelope stress response protein n=1 Tax=Paraconexibacter sp. AEG42_29 TaxID=2997339 RepID=A0AAU7APH0_9ACTN